MPSIRNADAILQNADQLIRFAASRNPDRIAEALGIAVYPVPFEIQKGAYKIIARNPCIFIKQDLDPVMHSIVLLHEIGHHRLHRKEAVLFQEFNLFDMTNNQLEFEANLFAAQIALPDDELLDLIYQGYDAAQIARALGSDINLVALKASDLIRRGHPFRRLEHKKNFLKDPLSGREA